MDRSWEGEGNSVAGQLSIDVGMTAGCEGGVKGMKSWGLG